MSLVKVALVLLDMSSGSSDTFGWLDPNGGSFSVSSAYELELGKYEEGFWVG